MKELKKPQLNIENASKLYDKLIDNGYDTDYLGDKDYFLEVMKKPSVRDELYNTIVERDDFKIGGREYYDSRLLAPTSSTIDDAPDDVQRSLATSKPASETASKPQPVVEQPQQPQAAQQPQAGGTPFNPQGKGAVINNMLAKSREVIGGMNDAADKTRRMVENAPTNPQGQQLAKAHEMQRQMNGQQKPMGLSNWGAGQQSKQSGEQQEKIPRSMQSPQPYGTVMENGEKKQQWLLGDGTITTNYLIADAAETQARGARLQHEFTRRMQGNGLDPAKKEDIKRQQELDMRDELKLQLYRQAEANKDARLQNAKEKNDAYTKWKKEHPFLSAVLSIINDGDVGNVNDALTIDGQQNIIDTENALDTEADFINQTQHKFDVAGNGGGTSLLKGFRNPWLREGTYSFGASDLRNAMALSKAQQKQQRGEELSDAEQRLMTTAGISAAADELLDKDISAWYSVGSITSESIPFMAEMLANPLSGAGKAVAKYAVKRMGVEAVKKLTRKQLMTKIAARALGDVVGAAGMAATTGTLSVLADAERRRMGDVVPEYDQSGRVIGAKFEGGEGYGTALAKSFGARTIENWSEMVGEYFSPMLNAAGKGVSKGLQKIGLGNVVDWATNVSNSAIARQIGNFESRVKFNGTIGEWAEEQVGTAANALLIGDSDWSDLVDARQQAITFGGVALMGGTISAIKAGVYPFGRRRAKNKLNEANEKGAEVYGERWNGIVTQFDEGKFEDVFPEQMRQAITPEEKESIIDYGRRLQTWRGYNIVDEKRRIEKIEAVEDDMRDNFDKGADTDINDNDTLNQIKLDYDSKVEAFTQAFGDAPENVLADDGDYTGQLIRMKNAGQLTEEQATAAIDYLNAKAKYDGAAYSFEEGIDAVARKVRLDMQSTANKNGRVIAATTKVGGNEVYVIGGDVVADAEGNIDYTNSSTDIVIKHKDTGNIEYSNINNLSTATDMGDVQQLSDVALDNATAEYNRKRELFQSGKVDTTPGAKVSLRLNDGTEYSGTIAGRTEKTGNVIVRYEDGNLDSFSEEELQDAFDRYNWVRVSQQDTVDEAIRYALQQDAQQKTQPEQTQDEQPKRFSVGSNVRVVGAYGGEYSGIITEEDADGYTIELQDEEGNTISIVRKTADELSAMQPQEQQPIDETQQSPVAENPMQPIDAPDTEQPQQPTDEQQSEQPSALATVPVGEDGAPKFEEAEPETAYDAIGEMMGNEDDRDDLIKQAIANITKQIDKASKKVNEIHLKGNDYNRFRAEKAAARQQLESLQQQLAKWNAIAGIGQQRAEAAAAEIKRQEEERKAAAEAERLRDASRMKIREIEAQLGEPIDMFDYVMRAIGSGAYKFKWGDSNRTTHNTRGLGAHIGLKNSQDERRKRISFLDNKYGYYPEDAALRMLEDYTGNDRDRYTDQDVLNIILDVLQQYDTPRAIMEAAFKRHEAGVDMESAQDAYYEEQYMAEQDRYIAMYEQEAKELSQAATESEINGIFADVLIQRGEYDYGQTGGTEVYGVQNPIPQRQELDGGMPQGTELLPRQESDQRETSEESPAGGSRVDAENVNNGTGNDAARPDADGGRTVGERIASAEADVNTEPTDKQKEAGNYKKGHVKIGSFDVTIENPKGSVRSGVDSDGERWSTTMNNTYGYIRGAIGVDGDHIDVYLSNDIDNWNGEKVFVIDVYNQDGSFDEHKVMLGFNEAATAREDFLKNYSEGWGYNRKLDVSEVDLADFEKWVDSSKRKIKPFAEYKSVKSVSDNETQTEQPQQSRETEPQEQPTTETTEQPQQQTEQPKSDEKTAEEKPNEETAEKEFELTLEDIDAIDDPEVDESTKDSARDYINGKRNEWTQLAYEIIKNYVRNSVNLVGRNRRNADETQLAPASTETEREEIRDNGEPSGSMGGEQGTGTVSKPRQSGKNGKRNTRTATGEGSNTDVAGTEPVEGTTPVRSTGRVRRNGGGSTGSDVRQQRGEGSSDGDVRDDNKRKTDTARVDNEGLSESEIDGEIENILGQMKDILKNPAMTEKGRLNDITTIVAGLGVNAIKFMGLTAKLGGMFILKGVYRFDKWYSNMHKNLSPILQSGSTLTDEQIAEYLRSAWHMPFTYKGQRKEICEWAGELEAEELSKLAKMSIDEKRKLQKAAEDKKVVLEDLDNIRETLPFLLPAQHEDVLKAEKQFFNASHNDREHGHGKGFLFTNGTGTGKTYTGLGIAKRFLKQGKDRILIVTVNDTKINDWIKDAKNLGIEATQLADTKSKGSGVVVTQFANMRQNFALLEDEFDLVIYDESHKLIENQTGDETTASAMHYMLTCRDAESVIRREVATSEMGKEYRAKMGELANLEDLFEKSNQGNNPKAIAKLRELGIKSFDDFNARANQLREEIESIQRNIDNEVENRLRDENTKKAAEEASKKTKVVFLSASPFNTPSNLAYAESYIFSYPDAEEGTTRRAKKNAFLRDKFRSSYRINGNGDMVRTPDAQILDHERAEEEEIQFSDHMQNELNTMSGRVLDSAYDYSRSFPKLDMPEAKMINNAIQWLMQNQMKNYFEELFDYNRSTALWEIFKTKFIIDRIREHIKLGRRVVVFHRRKEIQRPINEPFRQGIARVMQSGSEVEKARIRQFAQQFAQLLMWEQQVDYTFPSEKLLQEFATPEEKARFKEEHDAWEEAVSAAVLAGKRPPREPKLKSKKIGIFNGDETKGDKDKAVSEFNNPNSEQDVIAIQIQSGKEGISLHDTDGKHQRVMISLALPQSPIEFVQAEGRIYRVGNKSDAIFEYPLLGINRELYDFAMKINGRSQTTENLAMGSRARGLRNSIVRAVMSSTAMPVNEGQGKGGKMLDSRETQKATDFDHAITNWKNWRDNEKDLPYEQKSIPDPLGFKLVQWAGIERGETVLVGYAGNGSVARYVPNGARMIAVESDGEKLARLASEVGGGGRKIVEGDFNVDEGEEREAFSIVNKADVVIIKTRSGKYGNGFIQNNRAIEDVVKAIRHTEDSGRVLAVVPSEDSYEVQKAIRSLDTSLCSTVTQIIKLPANVFGKETEVLVIDKNNDVDIRRQRRQEGAELSEVGAGENNGTKDNAILQEETLLGMRNAECKVRIIDRAAKIVKRVKPLVSKLEKNKYIKKINNIKRVSITRRAFSVLFNRYIVRMHDSRSNWNGYDININSVLAGGASLIEQARNWKELRRVLSLSKEEFSSIMRAYTDGEVASTREALELLADIIKATLDKTDTQLNNLAEGRSENQLKDNMTIDEFIDAYKSLDSQDEEVDALAEKVFAAARNIKGLKFRLAPASAFDSHNALAHYKPSENVIELNNDFYSSLRITDAMKACCLVHETIHAVTCWAIGQYKHNNNVFGADSPLTQACKDIIDVFNQINNDSFRADLRMKSRLGDNEAYGLSNEYEMLAEMSNPVFRAALKAKKLWRQLINGVRRILQLDVLGEDEGAADAYTILNNALNTIIDNFDAQSYSRYVAFPVKNEFSKKVEDNGGLFGLTQLSLFGGETNVEKNEKGAEVEQKANAAIESFAEVYNRYADEEDAIITGYSENPNNSVEAELIQAQNDFKVALTDFYKQSGNSEEDAARMAKDMLAQVRSEVEISRIYLNNAKSRGLNKLDQEEWAKEEQQLQDAEKQRKTEQPKQQKNTCETAGGEAISVESNGGLPKLKRGEFAVVERQFAIDKNFTFDGKAKIESVDDVAYIFRQLESYCVEHAFAMLIKDGKPTIVHLGMGTFSATQVNTGALRAAVDKFGADSIYFIHNHPSGALKPSFQDQNLFNKLEGMFKDKKISVDAIIIDTTSGKYVQFGNGITMEGDMPKNVDGAVEFPVHSFSKHVFNNIEVPQKSIHSSSDVAEVLSTLRLGKRNKLGFLLLNRQNQVVGNIFSNYDSYNNAKGIADVIIKYALHYGAGNVITYGNVGLDGIDKVKSEVSRLSDNSVQLLDGINVANGLSVVDTGVMESGVPYRKGGNEQFREVEDIEAINERFNEELQQQIDGTLPKGHIYQLGKPGELLKACGFPDMPIELSATNLAEHSRKSHHIFEIGDIKGLVKELQNPIAAFAYGDKSKSQNVIVEIQKDGKNFLVGVHFNQAKNGIEVSSIRGIFPKNNSEWLNWIAQGKSIYLNKGKIQTLIDQQQKILADVEYLDLDSVAKIVKEFENPIVEGVKKTKEARMAARVQEIADGLNTPVRIVQSEEEVAQLPSYRKRHAKGWFDTATGEVVIVVPNNENMADVENTVAHEIVAHKGLRKLVGDERFDSFLDDVYNNLDGKIKAIVDARVDAEMQRRAKEIADRKGGDTLAWAEAYDAVNAQKEAIRREQTEEYMAELAGRIAESGFEKMSKEEQTVWGKVKERVMKFLDAVMSGLGIKTRLTDKELAYILYRSWKNLRDNGTLLDEAEDIDMRKKTGFNEKQQPNEPTDPNGGGGIRYRAGDMSAEEYEKKGIKSGVTKSVRDVYENAVRKHKYKTIEAFQDSMRSLLEMYKAISGNPNLKEQDIASFENAYTAENEMSSKNKAEQHEFEVTLFRPLAAAIAKLTNGKKKAEIELNKYLIAKHGLERNEVLARRDAQRSAEEEFRAKKMLVERALKADPDNEELLDELKELGREQREYEEKLYSEYRQNDYSGLTSLMLEHGEDKIDVPTAEQRAKEFVDGYETDRDTATLWECINNCTKSTLKRLHTGGLISTDVYERTSKMFEFYIPLRGYDETTSDEVYSYLNDMDNMRGSVMKSAKGRRSVAYDPIATIAQMADSAIMQANRNEMKQKFLNFVQNNPSDAVSVKHLWLRKNEVTGEWEPVFCNTIDPEDTPDEVAAKMEEFEQRMEELAAQKSEIYKKDKGNGKNGDNSVNIPYRVVGNNINEHQVLVRRNGRTFVITINGNPRAAQALNGLTNPDVAQGGVYGEFEKFTGRVNRKLSAAYTTLNPNFMASNFARDMVYANTMVAAKEPLAYAKTFSVNCAKFNPAYMGKLFYLWENGELDDKNYHHRLFKEFMRNGGETGFSQTKTKEQYKSDVKKLVKRETSIRRKAGHVLAIQNDIANRAMENTARFAAYVTSRTFGRDVQRSVYDAKEVSVNFNKKGSGAKMYGAVGNNAFDNAMALLSGAGRALFVFWNAGVQGMNNYAKVIGRNPIKGTAVTMLYTALGFAVPAMIAAAGDGDDEDPNAYYNLPEHIRRQNICINAGDQWLTIPLPIELRAFYGLGELAYEAMSGQTDYDAGELSLAISQQMTQLLPIDFLEGGGENPLMAFVPSTAKPVVEVVQNKSWTGLPIARENIWNENDPNWKKVYKNVNDAFLETCKTLSNITGGDDVEAGWWNWNPAKAEYILKGYTGGITQIATQMMNSYMTLAGKKDFDWRNVPVATRFVKNGDERTAYRKIQNDYFDYIEEYNKTEHRLKGYQEQVKGGALEYAEKIDFLNNSPEYMRYAIISQYKPIIDRYNKAKKAANGEDTKKLLEAQEQAYIAECVNAIRRGDDMRIAMPQAEEEELDTKTLYNQIATYDDWNEDIQFRVRAGQAKQSGNKQAQSIINKATARISKLKKQLGKDNNEDVMNIIRTVRKNTLEQLGDIQETPIEIKK